MATASDSRAELLTYLERQLIGPWDGDDEVLIVKDPPHQRYLTGMLFPLDAEEAFTEEGEIEDDESGPAIQEDETEDPIALAGQQLPSSMGMSFLVSDWADLKVWVDAARYQKGDGGWRRTQVSSHEGEPVTVTAPEGSESTTTTVLGGDATLEAKWRRNGDGALITLALVNRQKPDDPRRTDPGECFFQVGIACEPSAGHVVPYPSRITTQVDDEDEELELLYRKVPTYAIGHGVAAGWADESPQGCGRVFTSFMPRHHLPEIEFEIENMGRVLELNYLQSIEDATESVVGALTTFVDDYRAWAGRMSDEAGKLSPRHAPAARRLLDRLDGVIGRMRHGVDLLASDQVVRQAFALANEAMLNQMLRTRHEVVGVRRRRDAAIPDMSGVDPSAAKWRPFQLGFLLLTIDGVANVHSPDRDIVDLIWFPTGGGKTEAYLGLVAITVFLRRIRLGDAGAGTAVLTRYTLRLLTAQQFQRTATLICAMELIRRREESVMGTTPISIGLWVGGSNTPNSYAEAVELLETLKNGDYTTKSFQVDLCPWCGTEIVPSSNAAEAYGILASNDAVSIRCPNPGCDFHGTLPVSTVDEQLYKSPPTVLVGTVDKFAQFAWSARPGVFFGTGTLPGPDLVIQDEFHLIAGPLGTIVGIYESAFDVVMKERGASPKIVASTATIRRAPEQARGVFGRDVSLFPPSGLSADDSYYVRFKESRDGRLYVGVMSQGHSPITATVHTAAAMLQAPIDTPVDGDEFWTLVGYHNSLRELGKTVTLAHDDIPDRLALIAETEDGVRELPDDAVVELTSNVPPAKIPDRLEKLTITRNEPEAVSFVPCTNMLSVGVDVQRLGLMLMVGQPKTTAEYIQASSRVGRSYPGLVLALYSPAKPRDRSHFETFVSYHSALYRAVEPTSVTPFSIPSRNRALHAGLVILARHVCGWAANEDAGRFDPQSEHWISAREALLDRMAKSEPDERAATEKQIQRIEAEWTDAVGGIGDLWYDPSGKQKRRLLRRFGARQTQGWPTLNSMRNVDTPVALSVRGADD